MALAIDGSSPAIVVNSTTTATTATASFTPPANSLLVVLWSANTSTNTAPGAPSISGGSLTYTLAKHEFRGSTFTGDGQAAIWTAPVATSAAMTVTVTTGVVSTTTRHAALDVLVLTDTGQPTVGASAKNGQGTGTAVAMSYTGTAAGSWGFAVTCDWDVKGAETAGTGTTLLGSANIGTAITYGFFRRTTADGTNGGTTTVNATLPTASGNLQWAAVEVIPNAGAGGSTIPPAVLQRPPTRDPGETWWQQRDRNNALLVADDPLPMPLAVAQGDDVQRSAARWILPFPTGAVYGQRDRRDATALGAGAVLADPLTLPDGIARQRLVADFADRRLVPAQRPYVSDPLLLSTALLENELLGDATTDMRARTPATHGDRRETVPQRSYVDPLLTAAALLENELLGGAGTGLRALAPATHADRRQMVPQRLQLADQSSPVPALFDPTQAGLPDWLTLIPVTHADRREVPAQRPVIVAPDDVVIVGTGALGAWWGEDAAVGYLAATLPRPTVPQAAAGAPFDPTAAGLPVWLEVTAAWRAPTAGQQRLQLADQSSAALAVFDPTQSGLPAWLEPAVSWRPPAWPQQRPVFADPTLAPLSDPILFAVGPGRAAVTWPTDRREVPQQRPYISDPSAYPTVAPTDPLTVAYGAGGTYWLLYNTAALTVDRREVPRQRPYVSDPLLLSTALLENELLGGATAFVRRLTPATHTDRREYPAQRAVYAILVPPVPADPTLLGYLVARIARTWPTPEGRTWRPQQRAVLFAYGATPPYVRAGQLGIADRATPGLAVVVVGRGGVVTAVIAAGAVTASPLAAGGLTSTDRPTPGITPTP